MDNENIQQLKDEMETIKQNLINKTNEIKQMTERLNEIRDIFIQEYQNKKLNK